MPKVKKNKSKIKNQEPKYQINEHLLEERGLSFTRKHLFSSKKQRIPFIRLGFCRP